MCSWFGAPNCSVETHEVAPVPVRQGYSPCYVCERSGSRDLRFSGLLTIASTFGDNLWVPEWSRLGCPETSVRNNHHSPRNNPEERSSHIRGGRLKSRGQVQFSCGVGVCNGLVFACHCVFKLQGATFLIS